MGVVAICTSHFAFFKRVVRDFFAICTLLFVTGIANLSLSLLDPHFVDWIVYNVAIVTSDVIYLVL